MGWVSQGVKYTTSGPEKEVWAPEIFCKNGCRLAGHQESILAEPVSDRDKTDKEYYKLPVFPVQVYTNQ